MTHTFSSCGSSSIRTTCNPREKVNIGRRTIHRAAAFLCAILRGSPFSLFCDVGIIEQWQIHQAPVGQPHGL
jgi:hypothetical protein